MSDSAKKTDLFKRVYKRAAMPGFTTHYIIGQEGFYNLPEGRLKDIIRKNPSIYHLGTQGPDLFFYNAVLLRHRGYKNIGIWMHEFHICEFVECMLRFAQKAPTMEQHDMSIAYMTGYMNHCIADAIVHPYVYGRIGYDPKHKGKQKRSSTTLHCRLENDIDTILLEAYRQQKPSEFDQASTFSLTKEEKLYLSDFLCNAINETYYPERFGNTFSITRGIVRRSIYMMRIGLKALADPKEKKSRRIGFIESKFRMQPLASSKLVTDRVSDVAWALNTGHEIWSNPWDRSMLSNESFEDLLEQVDMKVHECYLLIDGFLSGSIGQEEAKKLFWERFGNYSLHSGLTAGIQ